MTQVLLLAAIVFAIGQLSATPAFARGFASLLERPVRGGNALTRWMAVSEFVGGEHDGRPVTLVVERARRYRPGRLHLGVATSVRAAWKGEQVSAGASVSAPRVRAALDVLIGRHALSLEVEQGWLKATWKPIGFFLFPGRFEAQKWRDVLGHMHALAAELETAEARGVSA